MVSPLSARLLAGPGGSYNSSSLGSGQKRNISSLLPSRHDNSVSGYSADREESSLSPPVSIDLHEHVGRDQSNGGPKRQKRNELQFAASTVKADLARAGVQFPQMNMNMESTSSLGKVTINLKGVRLVHSKDHDKVSTVSASSKSRPYDQISDYGALALACWDFYPNNPCRKNNEKKEFTSESQNSDRSTSSVSSDTESDSGESNGNNVASQVLFIPPRLEDAIEHRNTIDKQVPMFSGSCNIISCGNNAVTMGEMMQLSKAARIVVGSCDPFSIIHANAAFIRLLGCAPDKVLVGSPFSSLLKTGPDEAPISLTGCMMSSSAGIHRNLTLLADSTGMPVECCIKVSPVVQGKTQSHEVTSVTHLAVEFRTVEEENGVAGNIQRSQNRKGMPVGVMG